MLPATAEVCQSYEGYASGNWRRRNEQVLMAARLCGSSRLTGQWVFHWSQRLTLSDLKGFQRGRMLHLQEAPVRGHGTALLRQAFGYVSGRYHYYHGEYPAFNILLRPVASSQAPISETALRQRVRAAYTRGERWTLDPVLVALAFAQHPAFLPATFEADSPGRLTLSAPTDTRATVVFTTDSTDDSIRAFRTVYVLRRPHRRHYWQLVSHQTQWRCQAGRGAQHFSARPCL
jgi:hypothetical protein